ncbi:parvulin peptidyl-prolyl isomerase [Rheinheimera riviphila]|uniref:Periplasmic chaperone PpiD n=1 Tax=Rheinheimera riviphila TaxID=1834037 RepID=A0A437QRM1_9GAMM|nr:SurA N-terminal domain-containing protein [Rheinheimera riviphila]RVU37161.1 parvulin peptidyl-prolyl isomerase [Rheinheimera riviphila]
MLEKIREGTKGIVAQVILGLVILTFAVSGVSSYFGNNSEQAVAVVNGEEISRTKFEEDLQTERARMEQQFGEMFATLAADPQYMNNFRNSVLERLIGEKLIKQQSEALGLQISDELLLKTITQMQEFQLDGTFNNDRYLALLRQNNLTPNQFRDLLREQFVRNQFVVGVGGSEFALPGEMRNLMSLQQQNRDIEYAVLKAADFAGTVEVTDAKLAEHYQLNQNSYATPEQVSLQYVELKGTDLANSIKVTDADVEAYYQAQSARYSTEERRRVSHILLESAEEDKAVAAKAEELLKQLQQGADFAALAKQHSADTVSAENGGDLDFITKDVMEPEFEKAVYALAKAGDLSAVVKTSFGYHLIKLTEIEAGTVKPLAEVRAAITAEVQQEKAAEQFADLQQKLAEVSFEIADNLEEAATAVNGTVKELPLFSRESAAAPFALPKFLDTVFSPEFISAGTNSDLIELAPQHVVVARLVEHLPEKVKTLEEVKAQVQAAVVAKESNALATAKVEALLAQFNEGKDIRELVVAEKLTLQTAAATPRFGGTLDAEIRTKAFELAKPVPTKPISAGTAVLASGDVSLVLVTKVTEVPSTAEPAAAELAQFAQQMGQQHFAAVQEALKQQAEIVRNLPAMTSQDL